LENVDRKATEELEDVKNPPSSNSTWNSGNSSRSLSNGERQLVEPQVSSLFKRLVHGA
jgi:hypothetical protein